VEKYLAFWVKIETLRLSGTRKWRTLSTSSGLQSEYKYGPVSTSRGGYRWSQPAAELT
jgi:hypothetical protein